jgi:MFS superfamily sulfate permease-like transporter
MRLAQVAVSLQLATSVVWGPNWALGLPLIVLNVLIHVLGLGLINHRATSVLSQRTQRRHPAVAFAVVVGAAALLATCLHAVEAGIWAIAYRLLEALPDLKSAMLYSLNAMTSYGHEDLLLEHRWQLLGAIEALNGCLLFGLTTAFLFGIIQKVWSSGSFVRH